ncbi:glycogen synthase GlgA [Spirochaeta thermophila]|uniref:Glycogen synthase n=1 Tax=Winmispira thermophila (strain ATCC 49972 / DSM 6192 / RI 19.B1) TaxID=665571 RepID=E0RRK6_WINT6|nr:glycogen synthase GlgA [Spirochaeta thermophila]ADN01707.1 glycogen synthase [Spirochaeta thermophila DSM 6192]
MRVLLVTSEFTPLAKAGGLGDAVAALAGALRTQGVDARVLLPRYQGMEVPESPRVEELNITMGSHTMWARILHVEVDRVPVLLLEHPLLFGSRKGIYTTTDHRDFPDNLFRFSFLSAAAYALARRGTWRPEVLHCHDWPTAPAVLYSARAGGDPPTVFTIHNLGYQGVFPLHQLPTMGITREEAERLDIVTGEAINLLRGAVVNADLLTTVSPTYAEEIKTPEFGYGLETILRERGEKLRGILNGMDYDLWNPETDPHLPVHYTVETLERKEEVKRHLLSLAGLPDRGRPLVGMVTRLVHQKGLGILCGPSDPALPQLLRLPLTMIVLGTGERRFEEYLRTLASQYPNLSVHITFDEHLAHLIEGGADFFLMPSLYEPCGLNQMYSLAYGTIPVVSRRGGLVDTVEEVDIRKGSGTGFFIDPLTPHGIVETMRRICELYLTSPDLIRTIRENGMRRRFLWEDAARSYLSCYREVRGSSD